MYFNAFLTGSVEVCFAGKGKRFVVLVKLGEGRLNLYIIDIQKSVTSFSVFGTLICYFVYLFIQPVLMENFRAERTFQNCLMRQGPGL